MSDLNPKDLLVGTPYDQFPPKNAPAWRLTSDMRTAALRILKAYIQELTFYRLGSIDPNTGVRGEPIPFCIEEIEIGWPDYETELRYPSAVFLSEGKSNYELVGIGPMMIEATRDQFGLGTVLQKMSQCRETFVIEFWSAKKAEERAILAGIEYAMNPIQDSRGLRFRVPEYYNSVVEFTFETREIFDQENSMRNRRRSRVYVTMTYLVLALIKYTELVPQLTVDIDGPDPEKALPPLNVPRNLDCCETEPQGDNVVVDPDMRVENC